MWNYITNWCHKAGKSTYRFTLAKDFTFYSPHLESEHIIEPYFTCIYGVCVVPKGYSWNGCNDAPDFVQTYLASALHDALYQYGKKNGLKRSACDKTFLDVMVANHFTNELAMPLTKNKFNLTCINYVLRFFELLNVKVAKVYYFSVRLFGWIYY